MYSSYSARISCCRSGRLGLVFIGKPYGRTTADIGKGQDSRKFSGGTWTGLLHDAGRLAAIASGNALARLKTGRALERVDKFLWRLAIGDRKSAKARAAAALRSIRYAKGDRWMRYRGGVTVTPWGLASRRVAPDDVVAGRLVLWMAGLLWRRGSGCVGREELGGLLLCGIWELAGFFPILSAVARSRSPAPKPTGPLAASTHLSTRLPDLGDSFASPWQRGAGWVRERRRGRAPRSIDSWFALAYPTLDQPGCALRRPRTPRSLRCRARHRRAIGPELRPWRSCTWPAGCLAGTLRSGVTRHRGVKAAGTAYASLNWATSPLSVSAFAASSWAEAAIW